MGTIDDIEVSDKLYQAVIRTSACSGCTPDQAWQAMESIWGEPPEKPTLIDTVKHVIYYRPKRALRALIERIQDHLDGTDKFPF
jgi:hypothetical protein